MRLERRLRAVLPRSGRRALARLSRLRWITKARALRATRTSPWRDARVYWTHLLLDPEVDTHTYELGNEDELVRFVARALGVPDQRVAALVAEARSDPELIDFRWRWDAKRRMPLGRRLAWYAIARLLAPEIVVETGIKDGLGSLVLLRALERNGQEGRPGRLISFDLYPDKGRLVPERLRGAWRPVFESSLDALPRELEGLRVGMIVHDSVSDPAVERFELSCALDHAADVIALVNGHAHHTRELADIAAERGVSYHEFRDVPLAHHSTGQATSVAVVRREST